MVVENCGFSEQRVRQEKHPEELVVSGKANPQKLLFHLIQEGKQFWPRDITSVDSVFSFSSRNAANVTSRILFCTRVWPKIKENS